MRQFLLSLAAILLPLAAMAADKTYTLQSPDGNLGVEVRVGNEITFSVSHGGVQLVAPSRIAMTLDGGRAFGESDKVRKVTRSQADRWIDAPVYKKSRVREQYREMVLQFPEFDLQVRAFDAGAAYRFVSKLKGDFLVESEQAEFRFPEDWTAWFPYVRESASYEAQFYNSFENTYTYGTLSTWDPARLAFLPLVVEAPRGMKVQITESGLLDYPGMYLSNPDGGTTLRGVWAPYPKEVRQGGHNMLQGEVQSREAYIAKASGAAEFPWRIVSVSTEDRQLADNDLVWLLGKPAEGDFSWVKPGKVAWDWWNDWNLYGVDFRAGINNNTYKYYIDFAASHGIEYVILDEGWAVNKKADLFQVVPELDLGELSSYAISKGVGLILWAGYWAFNRDMETICSHYSKMGIAGWKIDFLNRDDQDMVAFCEKAAKTAAKYHQIVDFHGVYKPAGLTRTWPNVLNFEGVNGLEQLKWSKDFDIVTYDVTIPFTRYVAGPADYTQGAMRNAKKDNYRPVNSEPVSQGTRCHQLAEYIVFDAPFTMLCDSPSNYLKEPECTRFIASVPTVWDETIALDGQIGEYVVIARRSGSKWYIGALTNWEARDISITLPSEIAATAAASAELWRDGINADRAACDYKRESIPLNNPLSVHLAPGGGFVLVVE